MNAKRLAGVSLVAGGPLMLCLFLVFVMLCPRGQANPPAPYNLIYGVVRDAYGTPLTAANAQLILSCPGKPALTAGVLPGYAPGVNYQIKVPMDSGYTPDPYRPNALSTGLPFKISVVINNATNVPIEMSLNYATLGQPAKATRIDLTLGVDSNGDGIPDSWERAFLAELGLDLPLSAVNGDSLLSGDGLTLRQQYRYGSYPFNPSEPCVATFAGFSGGSPVLRFPVITGRFYSVLASADTKTWVTVPFQMAGELPSVPSRNYYYAAGISNTEVRVAPPAGAARMQFYRILVQ